MQTTREEIRMWPEKGVISRLTILNNFLDFPSPSLGRQATDFLVFPI